jgi:hypothetical protein
MPLTETEYEAMEGWESEFDSEAAARGRGVKKPSGAPSFKQRPSPSTPAYVTQTQLEAALGRVDGKIKTVSDGISTINARLTAVSAGLKKEADERKKVATSQSSDLNQKLQMLALMPLLTQPTVGTLSGLPVGATFNGNPIPANGLPVALQDPSGTLDSILPILLVSGMGGTSGSGLSLGGDGSDGGLLMMALVLAFAGRSQ